MSFAPPRLVVPYRNPPDSRSSPTGTLPLRRRIEAVEDRHVLGRVETKDRPRVVVAAGGRDAVEVSVRRQDQAGGMLPAAVGEVVNPQEAARRADPEDRAGAGRSAVVGRSIEIPIRTEDERRPRTRAVRVGQRMKVLPGESSRTVGRQGVDRALHEVAPRRGRPVEDPRRARHQPRLGGAAPPREGVQDLVGLGGDSRRMHQHRRGAQDECNDE